MTKVAIIGYGNIGRYALEAVKAASDMECVGIVRRSAAGEQPAELAGLEIVDHASKLSVKPDAAILATPTRSVEKYALECLALGISTADSFDIHGQIWDLRETLDKAAKEHGAVSVISAGWDPGSDSVVRALLQACAPRGLTYTNFGPGMSMGHTVAVKAIEGVEAALSMTIPLGTSIHRRMVYVQLKEGYSLEDVAARIKADPYFANDETHVTAVPDVNAVIDMGHGVNLTRKGVSGETPNQLFEFNMKINNPALTGQVLVGAVRAALRQRPGAYTLPEIPVMDLLEGDRETLIRQLV